MRSVAVGLVTALAPHFLSGVHTHDCRGRYVSGAIVQSIVQLSCEQLLVFMHPVAHLPLHITPIRTIATSVRK